MKNFGVFCLIVNGILALGYNVREVWINTENSGEIDTTNTANILFYTVPLQQYGYDPLKDQKIVFSVQACNDAFVYLSTSSTMDSNDFLFEFAIGGNGGTQIFVRKRYPNGTHALFISIPYSVDCYSLLDLWISWTSNTLSIGSGRVVGRYELSHYTNPDPFTIRSVGVRTGWGATGLWIVYINVSVCGKFCKTAATLGMMELLDTFTSGLNKLFCALECDKRQNCMGFNHNINNGMCELISTGNPETTVSNDAWNYFTKCVHNTCLACL